MRLMKTEDAVGQVICHDITQIIKGVTKDAVFRKGHIIAEEDIPVLLSVGKDHIYVWENDETMMHENEAAEVLCAICKGDNMSRGGVKEGKIELAAECDGVLRIDREKLMAVNSFGQMMIATRHGDFPVKEGDKLVRLSNGSTIEAGFDGRVNAVFAEEGDEVSAGDQLVQLADFKHMKVALRVDEYDIADVAVGQKCTVTATATEKSFESEIASIDYVSASGGNVAYYSALCYVDVDEGIYPGMQVSVSIPQEEADNVVIWG